MTSPARGMVTHVNSWRRPTAFTVLAYRLIDAAGLQRGRLTGLVLKAVDLVDADQVAEQISLDQAREDPLTAEAVSDRIRTQFGPGAIGPAATYRRAS